MIRISVVVAALLFVPRLSEARGTSVPQAPQRPKAPRAAEAARAPEAPRAGQAPRAPQSWSFEFEMPEIPEFEDLDDIPALADLGRFRELRALPRLLARAAHPHDDEDDDDDNESDAPHAMDEPGVHVYRMKRERIVLPRLRMREEHDIDERNATAQAKGKGSATMPVKGPVTFQVQAQGGEVEVVGTDKLQVSVSLSEAPADEIALFAFGDRIAPSFRGRRLLRRGKLHVELPRGSRLDLGSLSGDVSVQKLADVRIHTLSGDVKLSSVGKTEVQSISGDVHLDDANGPVRLHLVSGRATVLTTGTAPQLEFQSTSGSLDWGGTCAKDCHLSAETVSGDLRLALDPKSSFELSYTSHSGELRDELNLTIKRAPARKHGMASGWMEASFGKGEGVIEADAFSGNLVVKKK